MSIYYDTLGNGLLYNWYAVEGRDSNNVLHRFAPVGWHVPTDAEFTTLSDYLGGVSVSGGKMKSTRTQPMAEPRWNSPNTGADNSSGFIGLPGGYRNTDGSFGNQSFNGYWWSSAQYDASGAWRRRLYYFNANVYRFNDSKSYGFSVRCLKDDSTWYPGMVVKDIDGNIYPTVKIGEQVWLQSNWKCTKYADGVPIAFNLSAHVDKFSALEWQNLTYGGYCSYNDVAIVEYTTPNQYKYPTKHFILPKVTDLSAQKNNGLVAAYNMQPVNGVLTDISGNGGNMTVTKAINGKNGLVFNGTDSYAQCASTSFAEIDTKDFTICARVKLNNYTSGTQYIINKGASGEVGYGLSISTGQTLRAAIQATGGTNQLANFGYTMPLNIWTTANITFDRDDVMKAYINGVYVGQVAYSSGNSGSLSGNKNLTLGKYFNISSLYFNGEISDVRIYNKVLSTKEIKDYHNSFVKPTLIEDFKNNPIGTNLTPYGWNKGTGVYKVSKLSADVTSGTLKLPKNTHYLECVTAGTLAIPNKQAYGTWEFSWYKGNTTNTILIGLINSANAFNNDSGYRFAISDTEFLSLAKRVIGVSSSMIGTSQAYINNTTWYRVKITRTTAGIFTLFIKGGAFVPTEGYNGWTLVSTSGGTGTNPITDTTYSSSNYLVLDLDASDRITDIKLTDGIIV